MQTSLTSVIAHDDPSFDQMVVALQAHLSAVLKANGPNLFRVSTDVDLYEVYLDNLPPAQRQYHTCSCCRHFIHRFGSLVSISENGTITPAIWNPENVPALYREAVAAMARVVARGTVVGVALSSEKIWGTPAAGGWTHFAIRPPTEAVYNGTVLTDRQAQAAKHEAYGTLVRGLNEFSRDVVAQAVTLLDANALYRAEHVIGPARFLLDLHDKRNQSRRLRDNVTWRAVAGAPEGFLHPRSSMVGTLLEDIVKGLSFDQVKRNFDLKMDPTLYQRPKAPPSAGNIARAEKLVAEMGLEPALRRRYARLDEVPTIWTPRRTQQPATIAAAEGVFSYLTPKGEAAPAQRPLETAPQSITWVKFASTVLPKARRIEAYMPHQHVSMCALVTAVNADAPPLLQWDLPEARNPVSWYVYKNGSRPEDWGLASGTWVDVTGVVLQPSMWAGEDRFTHQGKSAIFILNGAKDTRDAGLCLFPEIVKSELHEVRSTIEAHSNRQRLEGLEEASASGLRVGQEGNYNQIRVTTDTGVVVYHIDRWD